MHGGAVLHVRNLKNAPIPSALYEINSFRNGKRGMRCERYVYLDDDEICYHAAEGCIENEPGL